MNSAISAEQNPCLWSPVPTYMNHQSMCCEGRFWMPVYLSLSFLPLSLSLPLKANDVRNNNRREERYEKISLIKGISCHTRRLISLSSQAAMPLSQSWPCGCCGVHFLSSLYALCVSLSIRPWLLLILPTWASCHVPYFHTFKTKKRSLWQPLALMWRASRLNHVGARWLSNVTTCKTAEQSLGTDFGGLHTRIKVE